MSQEPCGRRHSYSCWPAWCSSEPRASPKRHLEEAEERLLQTPNLSRTNKLSTVETKPDQSILDHLACTLQAPQDHAECQDPQEHPASPDTREPVESPASPDPPEILETVDSADPQDPPDLMVMRDSPERLDPKDPQDLPERAVVPESQECPDPRDTEDSPDVLAQTEPEADKERREMPEPQDPLAPQEDKDPADLPEREDVTEPQDCRESVVRMVPQEALAPLDP